MERKQEELHKKMHEELSEISLSGDFTTRVMEQVRTKENKKQFFKKTGLAFAVNVFIILIPFCALGMYIYENISVNQQVLPELLPMEVKMVSYLNAETTDHIFYQTERTDYEEVEKELGIQLLEIDGMTLEKDFVIHYLSDDGNWIRLSLEKFFSVKEVPIDLEINIMTSETQKKLGWDHEYLGYYQFIETIQINQIPIHLLQDTAATSNSEMQSEKTAVFVYNGIRYIISGRISIDDFKSLLEQLLD